MLKIKKTVSSPYVFFNIDDQFLDIKGVSLPENAHDFYFELEESLKKYDKDYLKISIHLTYANSPSIKKLFTIIRYCYQNISNIDLDWIYNDDDEDIKEIGEEYQFLIGVKFNFIKLN